MLMLLPLVFAEEFGVALQRALEGHPAPLLPAQRRMLTWEAVSIASSFLLCAQCFVELDYRVASPCRQTILP